MPVVVREVERGDAAGLAAVHVDAWLAAYRGLMPDDFLDAIRVGEWQARWTETLSGDELPPVRVAVRDGTIVGFCLVATPSRDEDNGDDVAEIVALNVTPGAWGSGIGTALMRHELDKFDVAGWRTVSLWVADGNERAVRFYERLGFEFDGASTTHAASGAREVRMLLQLPRSAAAARADR